MDITVIERLKQLETEQGELTTEVVLADAQDESSPLHGYFEWDDRAAAYQWRTEQARRLIRSVRLVVTESETIVRSIAYVRDPDKEYSEGGYVSTATLRTDKDRARSALMAELDRAQSALARAYDVSHALGLSGEIEALRARVAGLKASA